MLDVSTEDITDGSILRSLLLLATPLVLQNVVQFAQLIVDAIFLGRVGETAVAAVGFVFPLTSVMLAVIVMPYVGTQVVVSQRVGGGDRSGARRVAVNGVALALVVALPVLAAVLFVGPPLVDAAVAFLNPTDGIADPASIYLVTYALAVPFIAVSDTLEGAFVGWGDSRAALYVNVVAVAVNLALDPVLIFGWDAIGMPAYGVQGAALATAIGYAAGMALVVGFTVGLRDTFTLSRDDLAFDAGAWRELVDVGYPNSIQRVSKDGVKVAMVALVFYAGGGAAMAAYTIGVRVSAIAWIPASGLQQAAQSVVGQNLGAGNPSRAKETTWTGVAIAAVGLGGIGVVQWFVPEALATLFIPDVSGDALRYTVAYLQILAVGYWAIGASYLLQGGFNAARRTRTSLVASLAQNWGVRLPIAVVGIGLLGGGAIAAFWAVTLSNVAVALGLAAYYRYKTSNGMLDRAAETATEASSA
ncbi:MATE family efflux transporter [Halorubellus salinus]|uniref:MATE family efflux transporter n=1 Tax=Halorubellus salinus TaxID=755309 RepID=UPI001D0777F1|nr:MATE family efflux transporter [Halorubellus salinus]